MKDVICTVTGAVGGAIVQLFGGWDSAIATLLIFMAIDFATGLMVAGVFHKSKKTETGAIESNSCFKGLCRKGMILLIVLIGNRLDMMIGTDYIRNAVIIAFVVNETISIIENAGLMGIPMPEIIIKSIDVLKQKGKVE